jgi:hypothetical protein
VKANNLSFRLLLPDDPAKDRSADLAVDFLAAMPGFEGTASEPDLPDDVAILEGRDHARFEVQGASLRNRGVMSSGRWSGILRLVRGAGGTALTFSSRLGGAEFPRVHAYMLRVAEWAAGSFQARSITLGDVRAQDSPLAQMREIPVPRVFTPWVYVDTSALDAPLVEALRQLPDCQSSALASGLVLQPKGAWSERPTPAFLDALQKLPLEPSVAYQHYAFPAS